MAVAEAKTDRIDHDRELTKDDVDRLAADADQWSAGLRSTRTPSLPQKIDTEMQQAMHFEGSMIDKVALRKLASGASEAHNGGANGPDTSNRIDKDKVSDESTTEIRSCSKVIRSAVHKHSRRLAQRRTSIAI